MDGARRRSWSWAFVSPSVLLLAAIGWHWAIAPTVVAQIDLAPPYDAANMLGKCAAAWNNVHAFVGSVDNCFSWTPHYALQAVLQRMLGVSLGQAAIFIIPVILSWVGAYKCTRCLGLSEFASFAAAWVYTFIPARQSMVGVFATGEVCAALLPWIFYWVLLAAIAPRRRAYAAAALTTLAFAVLCILAITPQLLVSLLAGLIVWLFFAASRADDRRSFWNWAATAAIYATLASLWWIVPNALSYMGVAITHSADPLAVAWTFARASLLNEIRFLPSWFWQYPEYNPWAVEADNNAVLYASTLVPAAGLCAALIAARGRQLAAVRFLAIFALVMLFIAKGTHAPFVAINLLFYRIPGMFLFIEPYGAILIAALCVALAAGIAADAIVVAARKRTRTIVTGAVGIVLVGASLTSNLATVTGAVYHEQSNGLPNAHIRVPDYWLALASRINAAPDSGGVAILPPDDFYQADYDWGFHGADLLPITLLHRRVLMPGAPLTYTETPAAQALNARLDQALNARSSAAALLLHDIGVRYVVSRGDVRPTHAFRWAPLYAAQMFGRPSAFYGPLELYDLGPSAADYQTVTASEIAQPALVPAEDPVVRTRARTFHAARIVGSSPSIQVPVIAAQSQISATQVEFDIVDASAAAIVCDVSFGVWPRSPTKYELRADDGQTREADVAAVADPSWARFADIALRPGTTKLTLSAPPSLRRSLWTFMPPRYASDGQGFARVGYVRFSSQARAVPQAVSVRYNLRADDEPSLIVDTAAPAAPTAQTWQLDVQTRSSLYSCAAILTRGIPYEIDDLVRSCLFSTGRDLTTADESTTTIRAMVLADARGTVASAGAVTVLSALPAIPYRVTATGGQPLPSRPLPLELGSAVSVDQNGPAAFAMLESFSPTWLAIEFGTSRVAILKHERASGWRNAWESIGPGTVYVANWLVLLQWLFVCVGLVVAIIAWRRP